MTLNTNHKVKIVIVKMRRLKTNNRLALTVFISEGVWKNEKSIDHYNTINQFSYDRTACIC
ncbi:hypothetical protein SBF1_980002 [Candidatus Desulfosporosinus infrequens]|uniref:Uncharacterized protein n=1 Tax=Candidatus Desulfosporosinus infrequens TaxID=2043169 RepID=A0A2U3LYI6_9FIRM|nr:hypothetical protein SBF1_980002 [Candidatus Desulfosporosinus infrequens]